MDRRRFLRVAGAAGLGALAAPKLGLTRGLPTAALLGGPSGDPSIPIEHFVVVMMENHSFDNVLGSLQRPGMDGLTFVNGKAINSNPDANGNPVTAFHLPTTCQDGFHVTQSWNASHKQWNSGAMDGFVTTSGTEAMGYYTAEDLRVTHALANRFVVCDRWFCSTMCQTFPNRMFAWAGTSQGATTTSVPERAQSSPPATGTIFDRLNAAGVGWKNYFIDLADPMLWGPAYYASLAPNSVPVADFFVDAATGLLPSFALITPDGFEASEENPQNVAYGEAYVWAIAQAVLSSPAWMKTALVITYDEHGGYYDHVPPVSLPAPGDGIDPREKELYGDHFTYSGFRVPTIVVSPWARADYVSHTVFDHTSMVRFLERKWGLAPLTNRDGAANDMLDCFDFSAPSFATPPSIPEPNAAQETLTCLQNGQTGISPP